MKIEAGESVIIILHTPREKLIGILDEINAAGVYVRAIDLGYFDDWIQAIVDGEHYLPMSDYFLPMWRCKSDKSTALSRLSNHPCNRAGSPL